MMPPGTIRGSTWVKPQYIPTDDPALDVSSRDWTWRGREEGGGSKPGAQRGFAYWVSAACYGEPASRVAGWEAKLDCGATLMGTMR